MQVQGIEYNDETYSEIAMSYMGNIYLNDVLFQLHALFSDWFEMEEHLFLLLGGVGFSYRCRRSKRKGIRIYIPTHQLNIGHFFSLLQSSEKRTEGFIKTNKSHSITNSTQNSSFPAEFKEGEQNNLKPTSLLEFRNIICEGLLTDRDIIIVVHERGILQTTSESEGEHSKNDFWCLKSVQEQVLLDISHDILGCRTVGDVISSSSRSPQQNHQNHQQNHQQKSRDRYGMLRFFRLLDYNGISLTIWDAFTRSEVTFSLREFWQDRKVVDIYTLPKKICLLSLYKSSLLSMSLSYTKNTGTLEALIEWQNALRRKSIRNSWWSLFLGTKTESNISNKNDLDKDSIQRIDSILTQLYVQLVLCSSGGYRWEMSRVFEVLCHNHTFKDLKNTSLKKNIYSDTIEPVIQRKPQEKPHNKKCEIECILEDIISLYQRSYKKISFLGEVLLSIDTPKIQQLQRHIQTYKNQKNNRLYTKNIQDDFQQLPTHVFSGFESEDRPKNIDWHSYFDLMDETISTILDIESRVARGFFELHHKLDTIENP